MFFCPINVFNLVMEKFYGFIPRRIRVPEMVSLVIQDHHPLMAGDPSASGFQRPTVWATITKDFFLKANAPACVSKKAKRRRLAMTPWPLWLSAITCR